MSFCAGWQCATSHGRLCEAVWNICAIERTSCKWPCAPLAGNLPSPIGLGLNTCILKHSACAESLQNTQFGLLPDLQVSDHLDIGKDESDEDKVNALSAVHSVGDPLWVKVGHLRGHPSVFTSFSLALVLYYDLL